MATLSSTDLHLADIAKRTDPSGNIAQIVEVLTQTNEMVADAPVAECNDGTANRTTIRTSLPLTEWRIRNSGVGRSKSTTAQVVDTTGRIESISRLDTFTPGTDIPALRASEGVAHMEAMAQKAAASLLYSNTTVTPEEIHGLAARYGSLTGSVKDQIISAAGAGSDNTSIYCVGWSTERGASILVPKGSKAGLNHEDLGKRLVTDSNDKEYIAWVDDYTWDLGLCVKNPRSIVRICNIDVSNLTVDAATGANLFELVTKAYWKIQQASIMGLSFKCYMNTKILEYFDYQSRLHNSNIRMTVPEAGSDSKPVMMFRDMAFRRCDQILNTEAAVA